jgi:60 kDa SS-A/Ro ribonucleoprotein
MAHPSSQYLGALNNKPLDQQVWLESQVPQSQPLDAAQKQNNAGGFTYTLDEFGRLERFLILGADKNTYYVGKDRLSLENAKVVVNLIKSGKGVAVVELVTAISQEGRAPKNAPAVFALGLVATLGDAVAQAAAYAALPKVCRTATDMFAFVEILDKNGKWNNAAKRGVANWYLSKKNDQIAYQAVKYQQRNGWSHRDVLRLAHVRPADAQMAELFHWVTKDHARKNLEVSLPEIIDTFEALKAAKHTHEVINLIQNRKGVSWEMIPTEFYKTATVWEALIPTMGYTALIRKLGQLSSAGLLKPMSPSFKVVRDRLQDFEAIKKSRVHPIAILNALAVYRKGHGEKGSLSWEVNNQMKDVLTDAFYGSFKTVEPTGQNYLLGVDCSGSMFGAQATGTSLTAAEVAACMALVTARVEKNYWIGGFNTTMGELNISPTMSLDKVLEVMRRFNWGGTDCAQPMLHAMKIGLTNVDKFCVYTDNETWAGSVHPTAAIKRYRELHVPSAKLIVAGVCANEFTIADPNDPGMLDIVGFDSAAPQLISAF